MYNISIKSHSFLLPFLVSCLVFFQIKSVLSQPSSTIYGVVLDSVTGKTLPFAQLSVRNSTTGTATNDEGRFALDIPATFSKDTLMVTYMGYALKKYALSGLAGKELQIPLQPGTLQLNEVEILALTPQEVIRRVVANIPQNYGEDSLILTAFVRSQKFIGGKLAEFTEAIIEDLKTGYQLYDRKKENDRKRTSNVPLLLKGRVISDTMLVNAIGDLGKSAGCLGCNFVHDFVEFYHNTVLDEKLFGDYVFKMEEIPGSESGKVYHIWFDQKTGVKKKLWKGELFVNGSDFALLKISQRPSFQAYDQFEKDKYKNAYTINNTGGWYQDMPKMEWTTTYSARNGQYYLNTIRIENWLTFNNPSLGKVVKYAHKNEVVVTNATRDPEMLQNFKGDKSTGVDQRWDQLVGKGDPNFWSGYNYLPVEERLLESLKKLEN